MNSNTKDDSLHSKNGKESSFCRANFENRLAKSLGIYYRISLSKGARIIQVKEELEHVEHYLIIEKMKINKFDLPSIKTRRFKAPVCLS